MHMASMCPSCAAAKVPVPLSVTGVCKLSFPPSLIPDTEVPCQLRYESRDPPDRHTYQLTIYCEAWPYRSKTLVQLTRELQPCYGSHLALSIVPTWFPLLHVKGESSVQLELERFYSISASCGVVFICLLAALGAELVFGFIRIKLV